MTDTFQALTKLKIKRKTLTSESRHIRHQEAKWKRIAAERRKLVKDDSKSHELFMNLKNHRNQVVSVEARAAELANAFIRNRPYVTVEPIVYWQNFWSKGTSFAKFWDRVAQIASSFLNEDQGEVRERVRNWRNAHPGFSKPIGNAFHGDVWNLGRRAVTGT